MLAGGATARAVTTLAYLAGMGASTFGYRQAVPVSQLPRAKRPSASRQARRAETYWRRRFIVLVVGLAVFAVAAWALSGALAAEAGRSSRQSTSASGSVRGPLPGLAGQPSWPHMSGTGDPTPSPTATEQASGRGAIAPGSCGRADIVLSVFTRQPESGAGRGPVFDVDVVSTQPAQCSFDVGSRHLALEIWRGPVRIWSSADCPAGAGGLVVALERGVPRVLAISWGGRSSDPGCSTRATPVPPGLYTAYAVEGTLASAAVSFRLR